MATNSGGYFSDSVLLQIPMPLNIPGLLVPFQLLWNPRIILPHLSVNDIRQIDFRALKQAGYKGAIFDKDNCITLPHRDTLIPELQEAWQECQKAFGKDNVIIVSNSAGTKLDAGDIQAESVSYNLGVPTLRHASFKPSYRCIKGIRTYFSSIPPPSKSNVSITDSELVVIGDRIFTDMVLANRMHTTLPSDSKPGRPNGPLAIHTTGIWQKESMLMRWGEKVLVRSVERWTAAKGAEGGSLPPGDLDRFVRRDWKEDMTVEKTGMGRWIWKTISARFGRT